MMQITVEQAMQIALGHHQAGRLAEAEKVYRQILGELPNHAGALHLLGVLACQAGRLETSIELIGRAIAIDPAVAEYHNDLGESHRRSGRLDEAIAGFRRAIQRKPGLALAHSNLGNALGGMGRLDDAIAASRRAIELEPGFAEAHNNLGNALKLHGRRIEAIAAYHRAIALRPDFAEAHNNLGNALRDQGRLDEAIAAFGSALQLRPGLAEAHNNLGSAFVEQGHLDAAIAAFGRAAELKPDLAVVHSNLGNVFKDQGRLDESLERFRRAVELQPDLTTAVSNLASNLHYHPDHDARAILEAHRHWARRFAEPLAAEIRPHANDRAPDRRLRVGFVSPDFRDHPVGQSLVALFSHLDRRQTEIVCYSDAAVADRVTRKLETLADGWHNTVGLGDAQVADRIRNDRVDILVDLALHTSGNRLLAFARKPAPVQVTMLGLPATTGLATMDYRLTDPFLDPPGASDGDYTEQSIRLPHCFWCYQPPTDSPPVGELPARRRGPVTFGCLNQFAKVSPATLRLWVKILQALPAARLVIQSQPSAHLGQVRALFRAGGVADECVEFAPRVARAAYFERYHDLDLGLDPFPYNGHTSTLDALWMGVPVITLAGRTAVGRGGVSILSNVGLREWIAATPEQYVDLAVSWAGDLPRLSQLRAGLRAQVRSSPLMDGPGYAAAVEAAFRGIWKTWCGA